MADDFFRTADLTSHRKPVSRDPERNKQASYDIIREMLPANLPPTYIQQSSVAEIKQYILPLERRENYEHEPVDPPYYSLEVQWTPIAGTASFTGRSTVALLTNLVNNAST